MRIHGDQAALNLRRLAQAILARFFALARHRRHRRWPSTPSGDLADLRSPVEPNDRPIPWLSAAIRPVTRSAPILPATLPCPAACRYRHPRRRPTARRRASIPARRQSASILPSGSPQSPPISIVLMGAMEAAPLVVAHQTVLQRLARLRSAGSDQARCGPTGRLHRARCRHIAR